MAAKQGTASKVNRGFCVWIALGGNDTVRGLDGNDTLLGNTGNDSLDGGSGNDSLTGGSGDDTLRGQAGNDFLDGGDGLDYASYENSASGISVDLASGTVQDGSGSLDTLINIEGILGSPFDDYMIGSAKTEWFYGSAGSDSVDGGGGSNEVVFNSSSAVNGVTVKLAGWVGNSGSLPSGYTGSALDNWGNIDVFRNIFGVEGSRYDDLIVGDSSNNVLDGQGGSDTLDGGSGVDTAEYNQALAGINLDLTLGKAIDDGQGRGSAAAGEAVEVDQLIGIENVVGGSGNDMIRGDAFNNRLEGQGGNDRISGEAGDDTLLGGEGNDTLEGGDGSDHLYADFGDDTIDGGSERFGGLYLGGTVSSWDRLRATADISGGSDLIIYSSAPVAHTFDLGVDGVGSARPIGVSSDGNNDTLRSIEVVVATPFNDVLRGSNRD
ncbi:MAG: calcium-binding protein, partial [Betaproteobacteria bacterium]|nr:calcium-binding protein [Betaproteobacteria bacterium]